MVRLTLALGLCSLLSSLSYGQSAFEDPPHWGADQKDNFFEHGEFKELSEKGVPIGWDKAGFESGDVVALKNSKGTIKLKCPKDGSETSVSTNIVLPMEAEFVTILTRMRGPTIELGKTEKAGAGMEYSLIDEEGTERKFPLVMPLFNYGSLGGWKTYRSTLRIIPGELKLNLRAVIVDAKGDFEVDRVLVMVSKPGFQPEQEKLDKLLLAIQKDDRVTVAGMIAKTPELLEVRNGHMENGTPLIWASWYNARNVAEELLQAGADMEVSDESWQNTPLAWCCWWGNQEVAEVLIRAGAKTKNYAQMAANSKRKNKSPRGKMEDFDKIVKLIEEAEKAAMESAPKERKRKGAQ